MAKTVYRTRAVAEAIAAACRALSRRTTRLPICRIKDTAITEIADDIKPYFALRVRAKASIPIRNAYTILICEKYPE
jgi:hypothetical protein